MTRPTHPSHSRPQPKANRCGKCGKMTPLNKLCCQQNADGLFLVTEPAVCAECLQMMEEAQWLAAAKETETS